MFRQLSKEAVMDKEHIKGAADKAKGAAIVKFLKWALSDGQKDASGLNYALLPDAVVAKELKQIEAIALPAQ